MRSFIFSMLLLLFAGKILAQSGWTWLELPPMPEPVANNAVVEAMSNDTLCVYSFCGIDATKEPAGIHLKAFKYNTVSQIWTVLPNVPDTMGKIAAGATFANGNIYLVGGYHVFPDFNEASSPRTHIFDPNTDTWLPNGANQLTPVDDHVQVLYQDSLLYTVAGWSNVGNTIKTQLYHINTDTWEYATNLGFQSDYKAFGTSGNLIGDTIFYLGGAGNNFAATNNFRKGVINPQNPTEITWSLQADSPGEKTYRAGAMSFQQKSFWVGGSGASYNFDALAYSDNSGVEPQTRIIEYDAQTGIWTDGIDAPYGVMDLRGVADLGNGTYIIAGGMSSGQAVSDKVYLLTYDISLSQIENKLSEERAWYAGGRINFTHTQNGNLRLYSLDGKQIAQKHLQNKKQWQIALELGIYLLETASGKAFKFLVPE